MTATVEATYLYQASCADCSAFSDLHESEEAADEWAATHDAENHGDNGTNDEAYEKFKEARHGD